MKKHGGRFVPPDALVQSRSGGKGPMLACCSGRTPWRLEVWRWISWRLHRAKGAEATGPAITTANT
eukprot:6214681-Pleurochrysis_carterae.AAC.5